MEVKMFIPNKELMFVSVPDSIERFQIINYGYAGTWLMESDSKELNAWKLKLPNGSYEIIGRTKDVVSDNNTDELSDIGADKNFILRCIKKN